MNNIENFTGKCDFNNMTMVNASDEEFERYKLKDGDFLFNTRNSAELVGKTAVVEHLAYLINHNKVPNILKDKKIFSLDLVKIMANTTYRGDLEAKLDKLISGLEKDNNTILFIDEIHMIMGAGKGSSDNIDIANMIKSYLSNRKIQIIGATTTLEYEKYILDDKAFRRRFNKVVIDEPNEEVLYDILNTKK